ncbi:MAG: MBL fold metallo-hydrolase [Mogibacterium sp.]|nr:MBL fold metallo-hydrolase [Mogibacterium sp.]
MEIVSAGSSSSGNSYIIIAGPATIILDVGLPAKKIKGALEHLGCSPEDVGAVLITHEHTDHVKSVRAISRCCVNAGFFASRGTVSRAQNFCYVPEERIHLMSSGDSAVLECPGEDRVVIRSFSLSHDAAEPLGFSVEAGGEKLAVVTDSGIITGEIFEAVKDADQLVFEANHDEEMLMFGEYPYPVKVRIKSDLGHLSNVYAGDVLARILEYRKSGHGVRPPGQKPLRIMLAHLSFHNNIPLFAKQTVEDRLAEKGFVKGGDYLLDVAAKEGLTFMPGDSDD